MQEICFDKQKGRRVEAKEAEEQRWGRRVEAKEAEEQRKGRRVAAQVYCFAFGLMRLVYVFLSFHGYAQQYPACDAATAGASTGSSGFGRYWGNPASWMESRSLSAGHYLQDPLLLKELAVKALGITMPLGGGRLGATFISQGFELYNKQMISAGYARYFGKKVSAGLAFSYLSLRLGEGYGRISAPGTIAGVILHLSQTVKAGTYVFFPIGKESIRKECFQPYSLWGLQWQASKQLDITAEIAKEALSPVVIRTGMYYKDTKHLLLQGGIQFIPSAYFFGMGFRTGKFTFILNSVYKSPLGFSPSVCLTYERN